MDNTYQASADIAVLPYNFPAPGMGFLPVNAFVIKSSEPVLIDTGIGIDSDFMQKLESVIDPRDLKWVILTHEDTDHTGSLRAVLEATSDARLLINGVTMARLNTAWRVPMDQVYLINPGESISIGDRKLTAVRPPLYDNPGTIGFYDDRSKALFSADAFGAFLPVATQDIDDVSGEELVQGIEKWAKADMPWVHIVDKRKYDNKLEEIRQISPEMILSSHLPPAIGKTERFLEVLASLPDSEPFVPPNQMALEQMMAQMRSAGS